MGQLTESERRPIAEFWANVGVAWFVAGVINPFLVHPDRWWKIVFSFLWGILFAGGSLKVGITFAKGIRP